MKKFDHQKFVKDLRRQPWENVYFFAEDPNAMWEIWKELFLEVLNNHAPLQHKKIRTKMFLDYKYYKATYNHKGQIQKKCHYYKPRYRLVKLQNNKKQS
jgi:hypothetical protein